MDGRKFDWIRKQLGLSKVELARRLGISRQSLYRCIWDGPPKLVALAILGLWYQDRMEDCWRKQANRQNEQCKNQEANRAIADRIKKSKIFLLKMYLKDT